MRLEALSFTNNNNHHSPLKRMVYSTKNSYFVEKNIKIMPELPCKKLQPLSIDLNNSISINNNEPLRYLTPNNKRIIESFHKKLYWSPCLPKVINENQSSVKKVMEIEVLSPTKEENKEIPQFQPQNLLEKVKDGAIEVILERDQRIFELNQQINEKEQALNQSFSEITNLKVSFSKIYEEMQFENEQLNQRIEQEKLHFHLKLQEIESKTQQNCNEFLNEQLEKYKRQEITLSSEIDDKKSMISSLERENFIANLKLLEQENLILQLQKEIQAKNLEIERETLRNKEKNQEFIEKLSENETNFKEKFELLREEMQLLERKYEKIRKENLILSKEKQEISQRFDEIFEEKSEIEKIYRDLKEFHRQSTENFEKIVVEIKNSYKSEIANQKQELEELKSIASAREIQDSSTNSKSIFEELRKSNEPEAQNLVKHRIDYLNDVEELKEEVRLLENLAIEAKLLAAEACTDRDYFQFKYKQSLEFIKGMTAGLQGTEQKPKENYSFFKEIIKKFFNLGKNN